MKKTNKLELSTETVKVAIKEYLVQHVFQEKINFEISEITRDTSVYNSVIFKVTLVEVE